MSWIAVAAGLLGGIGLFLLGMRLLTDGLKLAAGDSLRRILEAGTRTPGTALLAGGLVTALVQSSSAVTVATIGFVNAGILDLRRAVLVVFGSNVGTTMTGWIVALVGLRLQLGAFATPLVGAGALLHLVGRGSRRGALGDAIAGFGLFLLGIEFLRSAFEGFGANADLAALALPGAAGIAIFVGIGFALTALTQSSSAALALTLTAASGGVLPLEAAAAAAIGTNVGTTSTAGLAAIGATPNARRVAGAHVVFNVVAAAAALVLLPLLLATVGALQDMLDLDDTPVTAIALFHTAFNLLGVALLWPLKDRLVDTLARRFRSAEEEQSRPRFLDRNVSGTPDLAVAALAAELARTGALAHATVRAALRSDGSAAPPLAALTALCDAVTAFAADMGGRDLPADLADAPALAMQVARYQRETANIALELDARRGRAAPAALEERLAEAERALEEVLACAEAEPYEEERTAAARAHVESLYAPAKTHLLAATTRGELSPDALSDQLDRIRALRRLAERIEKGSRHLALLRAGSVVGPHDVD